MCLIRLCLHHVKKIGKVRQLDIVSLNDAKLQLLPITSPSLELSSIKEMFSE